jgi:hypothetical protein
VLIAPVNGVISVFCGLQWMSDSLQPSFIKKSMTARCFCLESITYLQQKRRLLKEEEELLYRHVQFK